jgi:hypothetical protein
MMNIDAAIDAFVARVNAATKETLPPEDVPEPLREGEPDEFGQFRWSIKRADCSLWLFDLMCMLPKRFPPSFHSFISRYSFPGFQLGPVFLFGNTGSKIQWELKDKVLKDEFMATQLMGGGFLQIGNPHEYNYDPICFDTREGREYRIVQLDHEDILCNSRIRVVREIAPSFLNLVSSS